MSTCISTRSNYLAKPSSFFTSLQVHGKFKTTTKLSLKFCIDKPSQHFISCFFTCGVYVLRDLQLVVFKTFWNVL